MKLWSREFEVELKLSSIQKTKQASKQRITFRENKKVKKNKQTYF